MRTRLLALGLAVSCFVVPWLLLRQPRSRPHSRRRPVDSLHKLNPSRNGSSTRPAQEQERTRCEPREFELLLRLLFLVVLLLPVTAGCESRASRTTPENKGKSLGPSQRVAVGKNVSLEVDGTRRRVWIHAYVCQRTGPLEHLLTRKRTKEHEAILAADVDARHIHAALILAGAQPGSPARAAPEYRAAFGTRIRVLVLHAGLGEPVPAQKWLRHVKKKEALNVDWVFAGSSLLPTPSGGREPFYAANEGDLICVSNFDSAMLDLPIRSSEENDDLQYEADKQWIPALDSPVDVILEPLLQEGRSVRSQTKSINGQFVTKPSSKSCSN